MGMAKALNVFLSRNFLRTVVANTNCLQHEELLKFRNTAFEMALKFQHVFLK